MLTAGVIEGFFGRDWGWAGRQANAGFLVEAGLGFYVYAPKSDAYLRRRWREPMPPPTLEALRHLGAHCRGVGLGFGIGLSPFEIYLDYDQAARAALRDKVRELDGIGLDMLCILFDDMRGDLQGLAELQASIVADVSHWSSARQFIVCPTYYSSDPRLAALFGTPPDAYLEDFGRLLDPCIDIFWTGERVISAGYPAVHLEHVANQLRRRPFIWDNHIANDTKIRTQHLYLDAPAPGWDLPAASAAGIAINPMNQPLLSRFALSAYAGILSSPERPRTPFPEIAAELCGDSLASRLSTDLHRLQVDGLARLEEPLRQQLAAFYAAEGSAYSRELVAFLRGEYQFDPACLTS